MRKIWEELRNPIAILDLAAYWRGLGHQVDVFFLHQVLEEGKGSASYDLVGLSVLQALDETIPLSDAMELHKKFRTRTVVGGKWAQDINKDLVNQFQKAGIELCHGAGENFLDGTPIDFSRYPPWDRQDFESLGEVHGEIMTMRGCPFHCHFCHNTEHRLNYFSPARTVDNIALLRQLGQNEFFVLDDVFIANPKHMESIYLELKSRGIPIQNTFKFFAHIKCLNPITISWIDKFKPIRLQIGIESGDDRMLKEMGKTFASDEAKRKLDALAEYKVPVTGLFLVGYPTEDEQSLRNTLQFIRNCRSKMQSIWVSIYQPVFGTVGYELAKSRNPNGIHPGRSNTVTYVDPNLTEEMIIRYRNYMLEEYEIPGPLRLLKKLLLAVLPDYLVSRLRKIIRLLK